MTVLAAELVAFAQRRVDVLDGEVEVPRRMAALDVGRMAAVEPAVVGDRPVLALGAGDLGISQPKSAL